MKLIIVSVLLLNGAVIEELRQEIPTSHASFGECEEWAYDLTQITLEKFSKDFKDQPELVLEYTATCEEED